jgi:putative OPT family oligopeptide transporter
MKNKNQEKVEPYISPSIKLPEITFKAVVLGILLVILMAGSNAYLVLKAGMSVSACIPAAVISMAVLKFFKNSNILENNIVQTTASAGEVVAAGLAFSIPALVMIGYWNYFPYATTVIIAALGGLLGVLLSIPLRRAMIIEENYKFPEGIATAEVLKAGDKGAGANILLAGLASGFIKFCQSGFQIFADGINIWGRVGNTVFGVGSGFSLAMLGAGYVIGFKVAISLFSGAVAAWFIAVPLYGAYFGLPADAPDAYAAAVEIWNSKIRIIGVGMMVLGGFWMLYELSDPLKRAVKSSLESIKKIKLEGKSSIARTELDIPISYVAVFAVLLIIPAYFFIESVLLAHGLNLTTGMVIGISIFITVLAFLFSGLGASISSYMCGVLGSSNNPISGVTLMGILLLSLCLYLVLGIQIDFSKQADMAINAAGLTILVGGIIGVATAVGGDNLQDLKSGQLVGSTPWKQQVMLMVGVFVSALITAPIFQILFEAYGFGDVLPREGMDPAHALSAPKAALIAAVSQAIFTKSMDWTMVIIGVFLGVVVIIFDQYLVKKESSWRFPILGVAIGIYMPLDVTGPLLLGGILSAVTQRTLKKRKASEAVRDNAERQGMLFASGLIAGEALVGILLAIPFVVYQSTNVFRIVPDALKDSTDVLGLLAILGIATWFYKVVVSSKKP